MTSKLEGNRIYVAYHEGYMCSDWISHASLDKEKLIQALRKEYHGDNPRIRVFDSSTCKELFECDILVTYTDGHTCRCPECKPVEKIIQ